ncbi:hypothetical protein AURDEDRAFT_130712 [Auricularia subglabra TFB-10046 SS5]|uniref:Uncharacterized protein n=1 Tax=Auricularia subglabra (strain TFB-10046 / SS5) TaxID=717982 RepID=J0CX83_AURST|nr:hypothetical protein AURDEDRAFT_130712 [Auricularia subglabra TFB-10046 SS5]
MDRRRWPPVADHWDTPPPAVPTTRSTIVVTPAAEGGMRREVTPVSKLGYGAYRDGARPVRPKPPADLPDLDRSTQWQRELSLGLSRDKGLLLTPERHRARRILLPCTGMHPRYHPHPRAVRGSEEGQDQQTAKTQAATGLTVPAPLHPQHGGAYSADQSDDFGLGGIPPPRTQLPWARPTTGPPQPPPRPPAPPVLGLDAGPAFDGGWLPYDLWPPAPLGPPSPTQQSHAQVHPPFSTLPRHTKVYPPRAQDTIEPWRRLADPTRGVPSRGAPTTLASPWENGNTGAMQSWDAGEHLWQHPVSLVTQCLGQPAGRGQGVYLHQPAALRAARDGPPAFLQDYASETESPPGPVGPPPQLPHETPDPLRAMLGENLATARRSKVASRAPPSQVAHRGPEYGREHGADMPTVSATQLPQTPAVFVHYSNVLPEHASALPTQTAGRLEETPGSPRSSKKRKRGRTTGSVASYSFVCHGGCNQVFLRDISRRTHWRGNPECGERHDNVIKGMVDEIVYNAVAAGKHEDPKRKKRKRYMHSLRPNPPK